MKTDRAPMLLAMLPLTVALAIGACEKGSSDGAHTHADGSAHDDHVDASWSPVAVDPHERRPLPTVTIGYMTIELAQSHGLVAAGREGHLSVTLPYSDGGETNVRAWIGTEDRTLSYVGWGEYSASGNRYDVHATAPDPLPADAQWWVEIQKPGGTRAIGSVEPLTE